MTEPDLWTLTDIARSMITSAVAAMRMDLSAAAYTVYISGIRHCAGIATQE